MNTLNDIMKNIENILRDENCYFKSEIDGLSDLLWSMGLRTIGSGEILVNWFYTPVPAFNNRVPMDILNKDGEEILFKHMLTIPC